MEITVVCGACDQTGPIEASKITDDLICLACGSDDLDVFEAVQHEAGWKEVSCPVCGKQVMEARVPAAGYGVRYNKDNTPHTHTGSLESEGTLPSLLTEHDDCGICQALKEELGRSGGGQARHRSGQGEIHVVHAGLDVDAGKKGNPYGMCPKCGSSRYRKDFGSCVQCGYKKGEKKQGAYDPTATTDEHGRPTTCNWCGKKLPSWEAREHHINSEHPLAGSGRPGDPARHGSIDPRYDMDQLHDIGNVSQVGHCSSCLQSFQVTSSSEAEPIPPCPHCGSTATSVAGATNTHLASPQYGYAHDHCIPDEHRPWVKPGHVTAQDGKSCSYCGQKMSGPHARLVNLSGVYHRGSLGVEAKEHCPRCSTGLKSTGDGYYCPSCRWYGSEPGTPESRQQRKRYNDALGSLDATFASLMVEALEPPGFKGEMWAEVPPSCLNCDRPLIAGSTYHVESPTYQAGACSAACAQSVANMVKAMETETPNAKVTVTPPDQQEMPRAASASKVTEITEGILATNPGMNLTAAAALAVKTIERFPRIAAPEPEQVEDMPHVLDRMVREFQQHQHTSGLGDYPVECYGCGAKFDNPPIVGGTRQCPHCGSYEVHIADHAWNSDDKRQLALAAGNSESLPLACGECGAKFKRKIGPNTHEVKCPRCGSYDTEPDYQAPGGNRWP